VCKTKEHGGLGVPDLGNVNICLFASWIRSYSKDEENIGKL
jgi:hypothetical protein